MGLSYKWKTKIAYWKLRVHEIMDDMQVIKFWLQIQKKKIPYLFQKLTRGFSDRDLWNLENHLGKLIAERLKRFKEISKICPMDLTVAEWDEILDKMIDAFEYYSSKECLVSPDPVLIEWHQEGLDLFAKYYFNLWW